MQHGGKWKSLKEMKEAHTEQTANAVQTRGQLEERNQGSLTSTWTHLHPTALCQLLGHQCPPKTVSVDSDSTVSHRSIRDEKNLKCGAPGQPKRGLH